jgi:hypothetical protein
MGQELNKNVFLAQTSSSSILHGVLASAAGLLFIWTVLLILIFQLQSKMAFPSTLVVCAKE